MLYDATNTKGIKMARFFTDKTSLDICFWIFSEREEAFAYLNRSNELLVVPSLYRVDMLCESSAIKEVSLEYFASVCDGCDQLKARFEYLLPQKVKAEPERTVFGIKPFKGTVTINKSISGPILAAYREDHCKEKPFCQTVLSYNDPLCTRPILDQRWTY